MIPDRYEKQQKEKFMRKAFAILFIVLVMTMTSGSVYAKEKSVAGGWTVSVQEMSLHLVLMQKGKNITGTLENPHGGLIPITGEFASGQIKFHGKSQGGSLQIELSATGGVQTDGSLAGNLTSNVGDMEWSAVRSKTK
jgi:hypothetical protein